MSLVFHNSRTLHFKTVSLALQASPDKSVDLIKMFASAISNLNGIYSLDSAGRYLYVNDHFLSIVEEKEKIIGSFHPLFTAIDNSEEEKKRQNNLAKLRSGSIWSGQRFDNEANWFEKLIAHHTQSGEVGHFYGFTVKE